MNHGHEVARPLPAPITLLAGSGLGADEIHPAMCGRYDAEVRRKNCDSWVSPLSQVIRRLVECRGFAIRSQGALDPYRTSVSFLARSITASDRQKIALSMFAEIFRQTPADLPASFVLANGQQIVMDPAQVRAVQQGAWQAHLQVGRAGK